MWPSGRGLVPYPAQNLAVYNPGENPELQNQQDTIYTTYAPYAPYSQQPLPAPYPQQALPAPYLQHSLPAPYPQHALSAPYLQQAFPGFLSQQALPAPYSQQVSGVRLPQDLMAGDIVLRDQNWLFQNSYRRESMPEYKNGEVVMVRCNQQKWLYGIIQRISAYGVRIWIADAQILVNVPHALLPTHVLKLSTYSEPQTLSQPEHMWTMTITDNEGCRKALVQCVRPAHLSHRQLFHKLDCNVCAICKTIALSINMVSPWNCGHQVHNQCLQLRMQHCSTSVCPSCKENDTRQLKPSPSTSNGSTLQFMPLPSTSNALISPSNGQHQQWVDVQCVCGFIGSMAGVGNMNAPIFCPNCRQPLNVNPMTIGMQSGQPLANMNVDPRAYAEMEREILQRTSVKEQGFGWPMQSFSGPSRLEAIEEGREGIPSTPPSPGETSPESLGKDEGREEPYYLPSYLLAFGETFENNNISDDSNGAAVRSVDQKMQPSSSSRSSWQEGLLYEPSGQSSARSLLQDGSFCASSATRITSVQDEQLNDNVPGPMELVIGPAPSTHVNHVKLAKVEEADKSSEELETETKTLASTDGQKLWRRVSELDWTRGNNIDEESEEREEASSSNGFAAIVPSTPPVYVNHFADFVKLAMAGASTAKEILASASASSSTTEPPPLESPTPAWVKPAPALVSPAPAAFVPPANSAFVSPPPAFFTRAPGLVTEAPAWVTTVKDPDGADTSPAWITVIKDGVDSRKAEKQWELR